MEPLHNPLARIAVFVLAAGVVAVLGLLGIQSKPDQQGWRTIKASATHWTAVWLGAPLTGLFAYVWLFVDSSRTDAERQMTILFWLIIAFGLATIIVGVTMVMIARRSVRWRGKTIIFTKDSQAEKRGFEDIAELRSTLWGRVDMQFRDGSTLWLDPHAKGAPELIDAISDFLEKESGKPAPGS
jgi:succinate dehydrogenase hydrophobic anchor subunit